VVVDPGPDDVSTSNSRRLGRIALVLIRQRTATTRCHDKLGRFDRGTVRSGGQRICVAQAPSPDGEGHRSGGGLRITVLAPYLDHTGRFACP